MDQETEPGPDAAEEEVARVRAARHQISERFGHDPYRLVAFYMECQKEHPERLVRAPGGEPKRPSARPDRAQPLRSSPDPALRAGLS
jgi:hypothetical protein